MLFRIWKVKNGIGSSRPWFTYSIQHGGEILVILHQEKFHDLFPDVDPEAIPQAPNTTTIEITATIQ